MAQLEGTRRCSFSPGLDPGTGMCCSSKISSRFVQLSVAATFFVAIFSCTIYRLQIERRGEKIRSCMTEESETRSNRIVSRVKVKIAQRMTATLQISVATWISRHDGHSASFMSRKHSAHHFVVYPCVFQF